MKALSLLCLFIVGACQGCPKDFVDVNGGCYRFVERVRPSKNAFWKAQNDCRKQRASLLVIDSEEENQSIARYISQKRQNAWRIGLYQDNKQPKCRPYNHRDCEWTWVYQPGVRPGHLLRENDYSQNNKSIQATTATIMKNGAWSGTWYGTNVSYICETHSGAEETDEASVDSESDTKTTLATNSGKPQDETPVIASDDEVPVNEEKPETKPLGEGPEKLPVKPSNCHKPHPQPSISGDSEVDDQLPINDVPSDMTSDKDVSEDGNEYFTLVKEPETWTKANEICKRNYNGFLAEIKNSYQAGLIENLRRSLPDVVGIWLGGQDSEVEGQWIWQHSRTRIDMRGSARFQQWLPGQPNNSRCKGQVQWCLDGRKNGENCLMIWNKDKQTHGWNDAPCLRELPFICQTVKK